MRKSSGLFHRIEGLSALEHCPQDGDAATREGDDGLGVVLSFVPLAVVEGLGEWVPGGDGAEGALEEDALEGLVSAVSAAPSFGLSGLPDDRRQAGGGRERVGRGKRSMSPTLAMNSAASTRRGWRRGRASSRIGG